MSGSFVVFAGSRSLPRSASPLVSAVVRSVASAGRGVAVGCAAGADALALSAARSAGARLRVFAVGGPLAVAVGRAAFGFWRGSALAALRPVAAFVSWWAGGSCSCPSCAAGVPGFCPSLRRRLAARSRAAVSFAAASGSGRGFVGFLSSPSSAGTLGAARAAAAAGLPVVLFPVGFAASALPSLAPGGSWVPAASSGVWSAGFRWLPASLAPYAGCFVALLPSGRVVGHGSSRRAARLAAARNYRKEWAEDIRYIPA